MSKRINPYQQSFQDISFQVSTNKKQKKTSNEFVLSSSTGKKQQIYPSTQRKPLSYGIDSGLLMDQATTPMKYDLSKHKQTFYNGNQQVSQTSKHRQILKKLNETQQRLIQSQKKYGQLFRKYEASCQTIAKITEASKLQKEAQSRPYERVISSLKRQVEELRLQVQRKEHEISRMLFHSNTNTNTQQSSSSSLLQQQLVLLHRQKLTIISSYESKLNDLSERHQQQFRLMERQFGRKLEEEMARGREGRIKLQQMGLELRRERMGRYQEVQGLRGENAGLVNQIQQLKRINQQLQMQIGNTLRQSQLTKSPHQYQQQQQQSLHELSSQLQCIKHQITSLNAQLQHKTQLLQLTINEKDKLYSQILSLQQTTKRQSLQLLENSKQFKAHIDNLLQRVSLLQQQKQLIQRELLAQRLQTFKLKQELQQVSQTMKKQYQLSLQNLQKELSMKIHQTNKLKSIQTKQKQQIYIQLKELEKKYELLTSEMLTVDDMMNIATKVHKRHSKFVKK